MKKWESAVNDVQRGLKGFVLTKLQPGALSLQQRSVWWERTSICCLISNLWIWLEYWFLLAAWLEEWCTTTVHRYFEVWLAAHRSYWSEVESCLSVDRQRYISSKGFESVVKRSYICSMLCFCHLLRWRHESRCSPWQTADWRRVSPGGVGMSSVLTSNS